MDGEWIKVSFGGHQVLMARETLEAYEPTSLTLECKESGVMSSYPVDRKVTSTSTTTIHDLPDEMVSNILMCVGRDDLLRRCRLVSSRWKDISTELCRKRFVKLKNSWGWDEENDKRKADDIFTLFDKGNLPWSSFQFPCASSYPTDGEAFLRFFGKEIWDLTYHFGHEEDFKTILRHTPNVCQIYIYLVGGDDIPDDPASSCTNELDLRKLKRLKLDCHEDRHVEFLKDIITTGQAKLDYFKSSIQIRSPEAISLMASLLRNVPVVSCAISYDPSNPDVFNLLLKGFKDLCITELKINMNTFDVRGEMEYPNTNYHPPERFVAIHAKHLKKLTLKVYSLHSIPFKFPSLPALTNLRIYLEDNTDGTAFLSLLQNDELPILDAVEIRFDEALLPFNLPTNCRFETVTKLVICSAKDMQSSLSRVFPNLKCLKYSSIRDPETLLECFSHTTLEDFTMVFIRAEEMDMNVLLSGITNPDETYGKSEKEITQERAIHRFPSILQLTRLKNLHVQSLFPEDGSSQGMLRDAGACLSLLQLQPLNLTLRNLRLSEECLGKLEAHHRKFTNEPESYFSRDSRF